MTNLKITPLTLSEARNLGYNIVKGDYVTSTDNNANRWYIDKVDSTVIDRRGRGFATRKEALEHLAMTLGGRP